MATGGKHAIERQIAKLNTGSLLTLPADEAAVEGLDAPRPAADVFVFVCKNRHIHIATSLISKFLEPLGIKLSKKINTGDILERLDDVSFLIDLIGQNYLLVIEAMVAFTDLTNEEAEELEIDRVVLVVKKIIEVNYSFFMKAVYPRLESSGVISAFSKVQEIAASTEQNGATDSSS